MSEVGHESTSLRHATALGLRWSAISQAGRQGMQVVTTIILVGFLSPSEFGLFGMAGVFTGFAFMFNDLGLGAAVVQRRNPSDELLSSVFWVNVGLGNLTAVILFSISPLVGFLYHEERAVNVLRALSLVFAISGVGNVHHAILKRDLAFKRLAKVELSAMAAGGIVGIAAAVRGAGVWSLVCQSVTVTVVTTVLLWFSSEWRPRASFCWAEVQSVKSYGLNLVGHNVFNYFSRNADYLLIGRFLGAQSLGYYMLAYRIMLYPLQGISIVIGRVMFPIYSQVRDDLVRFRRAYLRAASGIALVMFPVMLGLMAVSKPFVSVVFGHQWATAAPLLVVLAPIGLVQSIGMTVGAIYQASGRTDWMLRWGLASGLINVLAFAIGLWWGVVGVAIAYAVATTILAYPSFAIPFRLIELPVQSLGAAVWRPLLSSLVMVVALLGFKALLPAGVSSAMLLGILVPTGVAAYLLASWIVNRKQIQQVSDFVTVRG